MRTGPRERPGAMICINVRIPNESLCDQAGAAAIEGKDFAAFETAIDAGVKSGNGCDAGQGWPFIQNEPPAPPPAPLSMKP